MILSRCDTHSVMPKSIGKYDILMLVLSLSLISLTMGFGLFIRQNDFAELIFFYAFFFVVYLIICRYTEGSRAVYILLGLGVLLRLILVFLMPNLSDDVYRFIWDGRLIINGISPFAELPSHYIDQKINLAGIDQDLFQRLNSPNYFTVYPPVPQGIFALANFVFPKSIWGCMVVMKFILLLFEAGTFFLLLKLLKHFSLSQKNVLIYALNPLIILDTFGNLHFEIVMIFFVVFALWLLVKREWVSSAFAMSLAVASKLLPLIFLPFLIKRLGWKKALAYFLIVGGMVVLLFLPFFNLETLKNFSNSLDLYFRRFEFNASLYYLFRYIGLKISGYNLIQVLGPALAIVSGLWILGLAFWEKISADRFAILPEKWLFAMTIFLIFTTTIHPWYLSSLLVLCTLTRFRYPVLWSGLIMLTYINYSYGTYYENLWIVGAEYVVLLGFIG